jgi:hypothetical protein
MALPGSKICTQFAHNLPFSPLFWSKTFFFQEKFRATKNPANPYGYWVLVVGNRSELSNQLWKDINSFEYI